MSTAYINRLQCVLAETCNQYAVNGITTWDDTDFYVESCRFIAHLQGTILMADVLKIETYEDAFADLYGNLVWGIPPEHHSTCILACLDELYEELTGES